MATRKQAANKGKQIQQNAIIQERKIVGVEDLVLLSQVTNEALVKNLKDRFEKNEIYTYIGAVIIACNPFQYFNIYDANHVKMYEGANRADLPPHIFAVAEGAFRGMVSEEDKQCVIISGESGAGKTEAAKQIMSYIAAVSGSGGNDAAVTQVKNIILDSNPVLEAFGNAMTLRNNNSSRFGKYFQLRFDLANGGTPRGGVITNYLLEKSRIVKPGQGERTFHIFYQLLAGAPPDVRKSLSLGAPSQYETLRISGVTEINNEGGRTDDLKEFQETIHSMNTIGISPEEQMEFWRALAFVLHLSNVDFAPAAVKDAEGSQIKDIRTLQIAAHLMGVEPSALEYTLTYRTLTTMAPGGAVETYQVPQNPHQAKAARDALAKDIYFRMFDQIIARVNLALLACGKQTRISLRDAKNLLDEEDSSLSIGVLDIYGFEIFQKNGFEQFCINYVNEKLQQIFIELTIKSEQDDYQSEGIQWTPIPYFDNKVVCELIEGKKPAGVFAILDDTCKTAHSQGAVDDKFLEKLIQFQGNHPHVKKFKGGFSILHYAGNVEYSCDGFIEANRDVLSQDMMFLAKGANFPFLQTLYPDEVNLDERRQPTTAGYKIRTQCGDLVYTLMDCTPHYVRCIKSNDRKKAGIFDLERVSHQCRYLGLLENVKVRRAGFAYRVDFFRFIGRFKVIGQGRLDPKVLTYGSDADITANIVKCAMQFIPELSRQGEVQMGKSKIFIKTPETYEKLQEARKQMVNHTVVKIQKCFRRFMNRRELVFMRSEISQLFDQNQKEATPTDLLRPYLGQYLNNDEIMLQLSEILEWYQVGDNQERIEYSDIVQRLNSDKKWVNVVLAITDIALYVCEWKALPIDPKLLAEAKKNKMPPPKAEHTLDLQRRTLLTDIDGIQLSRMADDVITIMQTPQEKIKADESKWISASSVARCMETQEKFSFFGKKRHRCHYTGNIYVKEVMEQIPLPDLGYYSAVDVHQSCVGLVNTEVRSDMVLLTEKKAELSAVIRDLVTRAKGGGGPDRKKPILQTPNMADLPKAKAMWEYNATQPDELTFKEGDFIELLDTSNPDWWLGVKNGKQGVFPAAYVQRIQGQAHAPKRVNAVKGYKINIMFTDQMILRSSKIKGLSNSPDCEIVFNKNPQIKDVTYAFKSGKYVVNVPPGIAGQKVRAIQQAQEQRAAQKEAERQKLYEIRQQNAATREAQRVAEREAKLEAKKAKKKEERDKRKKEEENANFSAKNAAGTGASFAARLAGTQKEADSTPPWQKQQQASAAPSIPPWVAAQQAKSATPAATSTPAAQPFKPAATATPAAATGPGGLPKIVLPTQPLNKAGGGGTAGAAASAVKPKETAQLQPWQQELNKNRQDPNWRKEIKSIALGKSQQAKPKPPPAKAVSIWEAFVDDGSGDVYYYNKETGQTQWEKPPGFNGPVNR